jgi:membrane protein DedA with SNARE-associated domain
VETAAEWAFRFLDDHAQLALFVWLLLEEGGFPMPVPGDLVVLAAGARLGYGQLNWVLAIACIESATLLGSAALFWMSRRGGRPLLLRFGRFLHLDAERLARTEEFLQRRGFVAVVIGRLTPGLRVTTTVAAGALGVSYKQFLPAAIVGSNNLPMLLLGYFAGPQLLQTVQGIGFSARLVWVVVGLVFVIAGGVVLRRRAHLTAASARLEPAQRLEVALWAGAVATATTGALLNTVLYTLSILGEVTPGEALIALGRSLVNRLGIESLAVLLIGGSLGYIVVHLLWAVAYGVMVRYLPKPDWLGGLIFALLPFSLCVLVLLPVMGAGVGGLGLGLGAVPLAGEALRHVIFGWSLSTSFTLLSRARARAPRVELPQPEASPTVLADESELVLPARTR